MLKIHSELNTCIVRVVAVTNKILGTRRVILKPNSDDAYRITFREFSLNVSYNSRDHKIECSLNKGTKPENQREIERFEITADEQNIYYRGQPALITDMAQKVIDELVSTANTRKRFKW